MTALSADSGLDGPGWAEHEFGDCELGDERLTRRLVKMVCDQAAQPHESYAQAAGGNRHDLKGYYRFLNNERSELNLDSLLQNHRARTLRRMSQESTALLVQDSTDLNCSTRSHCRGLGRIGTNQTGANSRGLRLHSSVALSQSGLPLGIVQLQGCAPESAKGKDPRRPIQEKDSYRCLEGTDRKLFAELAAAPLAKRVFISVPRQREHLSLPSVPGRQALPARQARVQIRFKEVTLSAPNTAQTRHLEPIKIWAVHLVEKVKHVALADDGVRVGAVLRRVRHREIPRQRFPRQQNATEAACRRFQSHRLAI